MVNGNFGTSFSDWATSSFTSADILSDDSSSSISEIDTSTPTNMFDFSTDTSFLTAANNTSNVDNNFITPEFSFEPITTISVEIPDITVDSPKINANPQEYFYKNRPFDGNGEYKQGVSFILDRELNKNVRDYGGILDSTDNAKKWITETSSQSNQGVILLSPLIRPEGIEEIKLHLAAQPYEYALMEFVDYRLAYDPKTLKNTSRQYTHHQLTDTKMLVTNANPEGVFFMNIPQLGSTLDNIKSFTPSPFDTLLPYVSYHNHPPVYKDSIYDTSANIPSDLDIAASLQNPLGQNFQIGTVDPSGTPHISTFTSDGKLYDEGLFAYPHDYYFNSYGSLRPSGESGVKP